jgi:alpha-L-fucosidase
MKENYPPNFTYQDFGVDLQMEFFDANLFADLIKDSGARYCDTILR